MINFNQFRKIKKFNQFDRFSKFLLIGNNIDGFVRFGIQEFENFEEVKKKLPKIIEELKYEGEWKLSLYQVADNYRISYQYEYYRVPNRGKMVFELSYMNTGIINKVFVCETLIHFSCISKEVFKGYDNNIEPIDVEIYEDFYSILLFEKIDGMKVKNEDFRGNKEELFNI